MKYNGIFWDIDGTLYDSSQPWDVSKEIREELLLGERKLESLSREQLSCFVPYEGLPELMKKISKGTQGIISNGGHQLQIDKLKQLSLYDSINPELIFTSYGEVEKILKDPDHPLYLKSQNKNKRETFLELREYTGKPSTYMFEKAQEKSRLNAKDCIMIGDNWYDIEGAQKSGMNTIYVFNKNLETLYNPWSDKEIVPNHSVEKGDIKKLENLLLGK